MSRIRIDRIAGPDPGQSSLVFRVRVVVDGTWIHVDEHVSERTQRRAASWAELESWLCEAIAENEGTAYGFARRWAECMDEVEGNERLAAMIYVETAPRDQLARWHPMGAW